MSWVISGTERGLLDFYTGATAAYSLRNLKGTSGIGTNVVRVRRSSDNTESDFSATQVSNGSLATWVGAGNSGFVRTWYDQSGNGHHAEQATNILQPTLASNGVLQTISGRPTIVPNSGWLRSSTFSVNQPCVYFPVMAVLVQGSAIVQFLYDSANTSNRLGFAIFGNSLDYFAPNDTTVAVNYENILRSFSVLYNGASSNLRVNGTQISAGNPGAANPIGLTLFSSASAAFGSAGTTRFSELIVYGSSTVDRTAVEANQMNYYGIR